MVSMISFTYLFIYGYMALIHLQVSVAVLRRRDQKHFLVKAREDFSDELRLCEIDKDSERSGSQLTLTTSTEG